MASPDQSSEIAWAAGLFEGEGTTTRSAHRKPYKPSLVVKLAMADEDVVRRFRDVVGVGAIDGPRKPSNYKEHWKPRITWTAYGDNARDVLRRFWPFLMTRRKAQAIEAMSRCADLGTGWRP